MTLVALTLLGTSCAMRESQTVDERLLAALGLAQSYQHQADELAEQGETEAALAKVRLVLEIDFPDVSEREDVRLDAYGRIAELQLEAGDGRAAEATLERGMEESTRTSYFKARLFSVQGRILRARAAELREAGQEAESRAVSREAISAFERSIAINKQVLGMRDDRGDGEPR